MEKTYWLGRKRAAMAMARAATCSEARLVYYDQAGRHSVRAAFAPFLLPQQGPATEGEREALRMPRPSPSRPPAIIRRPPPTPRGHKPDESR
ncbi:hypothetical protein [Sphingosinicella sp.]|uniref:hypothetical protein n=1 Tax=Sphingosinicella sp. TaxID=1917971 RepID=UPI00403775F0